MAVNYRKLLQILSRMGQGEDVTENLNTERAASTKLKQLRETGERARFHLLGPLYNSSNTQEEWREELENRWQMPLEELIQLAQNLKEMLWKKWHTDVITI